MIYPSEEAKQFTQLPYRSFPDMKFVKSKEQWCGSCPKNSCACGWSEIRKAIQKPLHIERGGLDATCHAIPPELRQKHADMLFARNGRPTNPASGHWC